MQRHQGRKRNCLRDPCSCVLDGRIARNCWWISYPHRTRCCTNIESLLAAHLPAGRWFLQDVLISSKLLQRYLLFDCGSQLMRDALVDLVGTAMHVLAPYERGVGWNEIVEPKPKPAASPALSFSAGATTALTAQEVAQTLWPRHSKVGLTSRRRRWRLKPSRSR